MKQIHIGAILFLLIVCLTILDIFGRICLILEESSYDEYEDIAPKLHILLNDFESIMFLKIFSSLPLEKKEILV